MVIESVPTYGGSRKSQTGTTLNEENENRSHLPQTQTQQGGNEKHKIYPYLLRELKIKRRNQVWGTDVAYIKIGNSFEYLTSVIVTSQ